MSEKRFYVEKQIFDGYCIVDSHFDGYYAYEKQDLEKLCETLNGLSDENKQLKKGMIEVVDRYIKNVECNPPSSVRTYMKIKGALVNIREDLRNLIGDFK